MNFLHSLFFFIISLFCFTIAVNEKPINCWQCSSDNSIECVQVPETGVSKPCGEKDKKCYVRVDNTGITERGCLSEESAEDCKKDKLCELCEPGDNTACTKVYPPDRTACRHCDSKNAECKTILPIEKEKPLPCLKYVENDQCFTTVNDDGTVDRGCVSDLGFNCPDNNRCDKCNATAEKSCNNKLSPRTCYKCSSEDNKACIRSEPVSEKCEIDSQTQKCHYLAESDKPGNCFRIHQNGIVKRGCAATDADLPTNGDIDKCPTDICNKDCIHDIQCIQCTPTAEKDCNAETASKCLPYITFCQQCESPGEKHLIRQCGSTTSGSKCSSCSSDGCNKDKTVCYDCDSEKDPNCAQWGNGIIPSKGCKDEDKCVVYIIEGRTIRGCLGDFKDLNCIDNSTCYTCEGLNCNGDLFPTNRQTCYQCKNNENCKYVSNIPGKNPAACLTYKPDDKCYMIADDKGMNRGCLSDTNVVCDPNIKECAICTENNCNDLPIEGNSKLSCIICNDAEEKCPWGHKLDEAVNCHNTIKYYDVEQCFTLINEDKVTRGCERNSDLCKNNEKCKKCTGNGCNNENIKKQKCIRCKSVNEGQESCADTASGIEATDCDNKIQPYEARGCYTENYYGIVFRGCLSDLDSKDFESCKDQKLQKTCDVCFDKDGCNNLKAPNSGVFINAFSVNILILLYLISKKIIM